VDDRNLTDPKTLKTAMNKKIDETECRAMSRELQLARVRESETFEFSSLSRPISYIYAAHSSAIWF